MMKRALFSYEVKPWKYPKSSEQPSNPGLQGFSAQQT